MTDILAIGAHPDDIELGAAGTLIREKSLGRSIAMVDLTRGELGTRGNPDIRAEEAMASAEMIGATERWNLGLKDGMFSDDEESLKKLVTAIRYFKPSIVLANSISDRHPDHASGASFVNRACFLSGLLKIHTEFDGKPQVPHRPKNLYHYIQEMYVEPGFVVDISDFFNQKMKSVMAFKSQFFDPESNEPTTPISTKNYLDFLESRAREMGKKIGVEYGEGFVPSRTPGLNSLFDLI